MTAEMLHLSLSLQQVSCLSHIAANYLIAGKEARRWGTAHESIVPYQVAFSHRITAQASSCEAVTSTTTHIDVKQAVGGSPPHI